MATRRKAQDRTPTKKAPPRRGAKKAAPEAAAARVPKAPADPPEEAPAAAPLEPEIVEPELVPEEESTLPARVERDLSHADALQRYMAEVARHPLLSREDEHALAAKFVETRDPELAYRLVTANLRLVVKIAHEYRRAAFNLLDLIQEGNVGLMQAVQKYDPFRGVKLSSYAAWWIRAYILRYLMDNWRMVKLGTTQAQRKLFFNLRKEQERLLSQGFDAAPKLLAERLNVSEDEIREMDQRLGNDEFSIDAPAGGPAADESRQTHGDRLVQQGAGADDALAQEELRRLFREKLEAFGKTLTNDKDVFLFEKRIHPPEDREPMTLQQIGDAWGVTRERARQLEARLTGQLKDYLRREIPDFNELSVQEDDA